MNMLEEVLLLRFVYVSSLTVLLLCNGYQCARSCDYNRKMLFKSNLFCYFNVLVSVFQSISTSFSPNPTTHKNNTIQPNKTVYESIPKIQRISSQIGFVTCRELHKIALMEVILMEVILLKNLMTAIMYESCRINPPNMKATRNISST